MNDDKLVAFILTHGRPDKVFTLRTLRKHGFTGRIILVLDDEDKTAPEYKKNFKEEIEIFSKTEIAKTFDEGDNFQNRKTIVYARNACFEIAQKLGIKYFIQLDDDYVSFSYRHNEKHEYVDKVNLRTLDSIFESLLNFYKSIPATSIAITQNGDFIGGKNGNIGKKLKLKRKAMNTFICSTERPFTFIGRINEDVNTYTQKASVGMLFLTVPNLSVSQKQTQSNSGGMTETYLQQGTYVKSFYSVMFMPSSVTIKPMGPVNPRLHHSVKWANTVPCILSETLKKK